MDLNELSIAHSLVHGLLPAALQTSVGCAVWLWFCRWYYRAEERAYRDELRPSDDDSMTLDGRMADLIAQRKVVGRGSPADRMFLAGIAIAGAGAAILLGAFCTGVAPASALERTFVSAVRSSSNSSDPNIAAVLSRIDASLYTSKNDFELVAQTANTMLKRKLAANRD